jgi:hypothetical protein
LNLQEVSTFKEYEADKFLIVAENYNQIIHYDRKEKKIGGFLNPTGNKRYYGLKLLPGESKLAIIKEDSGYDINRDFSLDVFAEDADALEVHTLEHIKGTHSMVRQYRLMGEAIRDLITVYCYV